jgi:hypothetical protein
MQNGSLSRWFYREFDLLTHGLSEFMKHQKYLRLKTPGFMDLVIEAIDAEQFSMAHYFEQNGDLMKDPEMVMMVRHDLMSVVPISFEMSNPQTYRTVFNDQCVADPKVVRELESFLEQWLKNIRLQGFQVVLDEEVV